MPNNETPKEYASARDEWQKATASLCVARRKNNRVASWEWANIAARHAENVGISNARYLLGTDAFPNLSALDAAISSQRKQDLVIITRHSGLVEWLNARGYTGSVIARATPAEVLNKHVIGKLPMYLSAITASVTNIHVPNAPPERRGQELSCEELDKYGAFLRTYTIREINVIEPY